MRFFESAYPCSSSLAFAGKYSAVTGATSCSACNAGALSQYVIDLGEGIGLGRVRVRVRVIGVLHNSFSVFTSKQRPPHLSSLQKAPLFASIFSSETPFCF